MCQAGIIRNETTQECECQMQNFTANVFLDENMTINASEYQSNWYDQSESLKNMIWLDLQFTQVSGYEVLQNNVMAK